MRRAPRCRRSFRRVDDIRSSAARRPDEFWHLKRADRDWIGLIRYVHHPEHRRQFGREFGFERLHVLIGHQHPLMTGDRHIDRHQTVRGPAERWTPVDHGNGPWFAQVADIEDYAAAMPIADIKPVPPADRMGAAME